MGLMRDCLQCGQPFKPHTAAMKSGWARFCSHRCQALAQHAQKWADGSYNRITSYKYASGQGRPARHEHVVIVERVLGKPLPPRAEVHHVNGAKSDNRNQNLVICQDHSYHALLHALQRVKAAGGIPFIDKICTSCRAVKPKTAFSGGGRNSAGTPMLNARCRDCEKTRLAHYNGLRPKTSDAKWFQQ